VFGSLSAHHVVMRQVDKSGSVAEKRTPEIPDGISERPAEAVSWATADSRAAGPAVAHDRRPRSPTWLRRGLFVKIHVWLLGPCCSDQRNLRAPSCPPG